MSFILKKALNLSQFALYLQEAEQTNQYTNYGASVRLLENRARAMLKIDATKAVVATCNGAAAINVIIASIKNIIDIATVQSQDFTFSCNFQIPNVTTDCIDLTDSDEIDISSFKANSIIIVTNCFGSLQNINTLLKAAASINSYIVFDNAASPYSMYKGNNSCNYGIASYISLHHTKPIGFGEGGLVIIDKEYESIARAIIDFGKYNNSYLACGNNYKMSELAAASILQWWDTFNIDILASQYRNNYEIKAKKYISKEYRTLTNFSDTLEFFPNCLPLIRINADAADIQEKDIRKYYKPWASLPVAASLYDRIQCIPITENI